MRRLSLEEHIESKHYYRNLYRKLLRWNQYAVSLMMMQVLLIIYVYATRAEIDYYATNSASSIKPLQALHAPNESSQALLLPDLPEELGKKDLQI